MVMLKLCVKHNVPLIVCVCVYVAVLQTYRDLAWFCPQSTAAVCRAVEGCDDLPQDDEVWKLKTQLLSCFIL